MDAFQLQQPSSLNPLGASIVGIFPVNIHSASSSAYQAELRRVFPKAIEISDQLGAFGGWFAGLGLLGIICI
ncbi:hypothetical protein [Dyella acidiphila]|uniref:Uncharacterized protein n=1 Tax=Dyella acidiphila TaxID=2775866 RepID=A0ABR9GAM9_9GAMM|nr:hypothetical protein [Dyella acidiphila]MBE1161107.1 hypothetical protein [Dyella acidiphila]